jgi:spore coat protein SA
MQCQWLEQIDAAVIEPRINSADLVLGCSNFIAEGVRRRFPSLAGRCHYVYNGADIAFFARPSGVQPKPKQILFVDRLSPEKGVHILLDSFRIVLAQHPDAHLQLIGPINVVPYDMIAAICDDPHVKAIAPYFRRGVFAELLRAKVSELPSGSVSFFNEGMKFIELAPHYHSANFCISLGLGRALRRAFGRSDGVGHARCNHAWRRLSGNCRRRPERLACGAL